MTSFYIRGSSSYNGAAAAPVESKLVTITKENSVQVIDAVLGSLSTHIIFLSLLSNFSL